MTEYLWAELRAHAIERFSEVPGADAENRILHVFREHPQIVAALIDAVAARVDKGDIRSGWAILAHDCERAAERGTVKATDSRDRTKAISRAEQWIHAAGIHYDRPDEIEDELFGDQGRLRAWKADTELRERLLQMWRDRRPAGEKVEQEAEERGRRHIKHQTAPRKIRQAPIPEKTPEPAAIDPTQQIPF